MISLKKKTLKRNQRRNLIKYTRKRSGGHQGR